MLDKWQNSFKWFNLSIAIWICLYNVRRFFHRRDAHAWFEKVHIGDIIWYISMLISFSICFIFTLFTTWHFIGPLKSFSYHLNTSVWNKSWKSMNRGFAMQRRCVDCIQWNRTHKLPQSMDAHQSLKKIWVTTNICFKISIT